MEALTSINPLAIQVLFMTEPCASHLDLGSNDGRTLRGLDKSIITCVELFEPSVKVLQGEGFHAVYQRDIREQVKLFSGEMQVEPSTSCAFAFGPDSNYPLWQFDRVTAYDVIEHLPKEDGLILLDQIEQIAAREIILFLPIETPELEATTAWQKHREEGLAQHPTAQRELHGHLSRWAPEELAARGYFILQLRDFHFPGFGAFFAAKYRDPAVQAMVAARVQSWAASLHPQPPTGPRINQPLLVLGRERMDIHPSVVIGYGARLEAIGEYCGRQYNGRIVIGEGTTAEYFLHIGAAESVSIGKDCMLAGYVSITDHDHGLLADRLLHGQPLTVKPVKIGDSVFIGERSFIGKGVTIGDRAVIGAGAVVVKDVPAGAVVVGVPASVIRQKDDARPFIQHSYAGRAYAPGPPLVSIVVPTCYAEGAKVQECLWSVRKHTSEPHEVIIVNNGSQNWTLAQWGYRENVTIVHNQDNLGFAHACNQGIAAANGQYVLLLNDDTEATPGWLAAMLAVMESDPTVGLVGPMSDNVSGPQCGPAVPGAKPTPIMRLVGHCLLIRRQVIDKIGGLDESFADGHFTDDDLCLRAAAAGYKAVIARDAFVHHAGSQTFKALGIDYGASLTAAWQQFSAKWGARGGGPASGSYQVDVPAWDRERCFIPLPSVSTQPYR